MAVMLVLLIVDTNLSTLLYCLDERIHPRCAQRNLFKENPVLHHTEGNKVLGHTIVRKQPFCRFIVIEYFRIAYEIDRVLALLLAFNVDAEHLLDGFPALVESPWRHASIVCRNTLPAVFYFFKTQLLL